MIPDAAVGVIGKGVGHGCGVGDGGTVPIPLSDALCGLFVALSFTVKMPLRIPLTLGMKMMPMVQLLPGVRMRLLQPSLILKKSL